MILLVLVEDLPSARLFEARALISEQPGRGGPHCEANTKRTGEWSLLADGV